MSSFTLRSVRLALPAILIAIALGGCSGTNPSGPAPSTLAGLPTVGPTTTSTTTETKTAAADYRSLLLTAADVSDTEDTFAPRSNDAKPSGVPGASAFFVNAADTRAISDTLMMFPDPPAASAALRQASGRLASQVTGGAPTAAAVGTDGVTVSGTYPGDQKAVTLLLFTHGTALVRLEFQSAPGDPTTERYITSVGKMQQIALRTGLADPQ